MSGSRSALRGITARRSRLAAILSGAIVALLVAGVAGAGLFQQLGQSLGGPSPASGHAEVIAHGVAPMPATQVAWRVVEDTAEPLADAEYQERALGFALATDGAIVVNSATYGTQQRLAAGEAAFVPDGAFELRNSATDNAVSYARLALVPAEAATDPGGDSLLYAGDPFTAPALPSGHNGFDLDLVRDVLEDGEAMDLPDTGYPTLIYVTVGAVTIDNVAQNTIELAAGEAIAIPGNPVITAEEDAVVVAALIGPAVPTPPAPPRTTGSITITTSFCPEEMTEETFDPETCEAGPVDGGLALILADDSTLAADDSREDEGIYSWGGLAFGTYGLAKLDPQEGYTVHVLLDADGDELDPAELTISQQAPDLSATLYLLPVPAGTGSLSLATYVCPEGMTPENMVGDACDLAEGDFDWQVMETTTGGISLTLADATGDGQPFYTWSDLPFGDYVFYPIQMPEGYVVAVVPGAEPGPQGTWLVTIGADEPDVQLLAYLFRAEGPEEQPGTLTATFNVCPEGAQPSSFDPSQCELATGLDYAFELANLDVPGEPLSLTLADAQISGATATWSQLPLGVYQLYPTPPTGYELSAIVGADGGDNVTSPYVVELTEAGPERAIEVYFFLPTGNTGTVAFVGAQCPTAESSDEECISANLAAVDADLLDGGGNPLPANIHGVNLVWGEGEGLPVGTYTLVIDLTTLPEGYTLDHVAGAYDDGDGDPATWAVDVTEATPNALTYAILDPAP